MAGDGFILHGPSVAAFGRVEDELARGDHADDPQRSARIGSDLFAIADVVRSEPRLRRTLTDVSVDSQARAGLVRNLFEGKVDDASLAVSATAVAQRWSSPGDLAVALERLGVETTVRSASDAGRLEDELFAVQRLLTTYPALRNALGDPARSAADKRELLTSITGARISAATSTLVAQAVSGGHRTVDLALEDYQRVAASVRGESVATVRSARALSPQEQGRLAEALSRQYDRAVHLNVVVDQSLIGGVRVEIGDDVIDGSVASRLDEARRRLAG